jgi:hypothetical protein
MFKKDGLSRIYICLPSNASGHSVKLQRIILFGGKILSAISISTNSNYSKLNLPNTSACRNVAMLHKFEYACDLRI